MYSGIKCGTFYTNGGFGNVIDGFVKLCKELSVKFVTNTNVEKINVENNLAKSITTNNGIYEFDDIVAADYNHVEQSLLSIDQRNYSKKYWEKKVFSPSSLLFYLGINKKLLKLEHHNLFFDEDIEVHIGEIYNSPQWPSKPLFYSCCPSKTDNSVAPKRKRKCFFINAFIPAGIGDSEKMRNKYFEIMIKRLEDYCGEDILNHIEFKRSYFIDDFISDYNAFKGNAYGLANTLTQTS